MANNRLYIRCTGCGEKIMIAKNFLGKWDMRNAYAVEDFLVEHGCNRMCLYEDSATLSQFEFVNEIEDDV